MKKLLPILFLTLFTTLVNAQVSKTIDLTAAGTLSSILNSNEKATITNLVVTGSIDARDVKCMRDEMPVLAVLDISAVNIMAYKGEDGTMLGQPVEKEIYPENEMPYGSFFLMASQGKESLKTIFLPNSITSIGQYAFDGCKGLTSITIPESVSSLGECAFYNCTQLKTIRCLNSIPPTLGYECFYLYIYCSPSLIMIPNAVYVPVGSISAYKTATGWSNFTNMFEYILTVTTKTFARIDSSTVILYANIDLITDSPVTAHGFCWNTTGSPTTADQKVDNGATTKLGAYNNKISDLPVGLTYYVRAFATDGKETVYGNQVSFKTVFLPSAASTISGYTSICQGESDVTYTVPTINHTTTYIWTLPYGITGTSTTNSITVNYSNSATSGEITVMGLNENGNGTISSLPITVNQLPVITITNKMVICGESVSLDALISYAGTGTLTYLWSPATGLSDATIANPTATVTSEITYALTVTTPNGCIATNYVSVKILPMDKPQIGIVSVNSSNKNMVFWNKPESIGIDYYTIYRETSKSDVYENIGIVSYNDLSVFVDSSSIPDVKSNKYKISIFDKNGIESPLSDPHKTMHLSINKGQNNTWNLIWEPYYGFTPSSYTIYRGTNASNLTILDATSGSSTQYSDISAPSGDVFYQLEVISPTITTPSQVKSYLQKSKESAQTNLVSYNSSRSNIATNKIIDPDAENNDIEVFPNPVKDQLIINQDGQSTFEILNLFGQVVCHGNLNNKTIVQTSNLSSGIYLLKIGKKLKKIIKN